MSTPREGHPGHHDHGHGANSHGRLFIVVMLNAIIAAAELAGGVLSGSLALLSDAGHNFSDVLSLVLGWAGEKISTRGASKKYSFGMKRFEVLVALVNALWLICIALYIIAEASERFASPVRVDLGIMIPVALIGLAGNGISILILRRGKNRSLNMRAAFMHLFYDTLSSIAVIGAGIVLFLTGMYWMDLAASIAIVFMMTWSSGGIIKESFRIFLQGTPRGLDSAEVYRSILREKHVSGVHGLHIWSINSQEVFLSCHICVTLEDDFDHDGIIRSVNAMLEQKYGITHTTIQIEHNMICDPESGVCCR